MATDKIIFESSTIGMPIDSEAQLMSRNLLYILSGSRNKLEAKHINEEGKQ